MTAEITARKSRIERELRSIWDQRGCLTPSLVVEEARAAGHPLHDELEWDDSVAGAEYRLQQAAAMIRSVKITLTREDRPDEEHKIRAWLPAKYAGPDDAKPGQYVPTEDVGGLQRELMLRQMRRELAALERRYRGLEEFWAALDGMRLK